MSEARGIRLAPSAAVKEKRLASLLAGRDPEGPEIQRPVWDAQLLGSLELAGQRVTWNEVVASRSGSGPEAVLRLRRAVAAVPPGAALTIAALRAWHEALLGPGVGFRASERPREGFPPSPPALIEGRLAILEQWMGSEGATGLKPVQQAALAVARLVEILPFEDGNGRLARLAASHLMVGGGMRPPILVGGDGPRLVAVMQAAFHFDTGPLCALLVESSERCLDVMIQALENPAPPR